MSYGAFGSTINITEGQVMSPHTVDGDTVAHWELNGDGVDVVNGNNMATGKYLACPILGSNTKVGMRVNHSDLFRMNVYNAALDYTTWATPNMTIAMCVWFDSLAIQADLIRLEVYAGGQAKWRIRCLSDGRIGVSLDTVAGFVTYASTMTVPLKTWTWVAVTFNTDGKSGLMRIGATEESWSHPNPTNVGGTSQSITIMDAWNTNPGQGCVYSVIMKDITSTSAQLDAMFSQTGLRP